MEIRTLDQIWEEFDTQNILKADARDDLVWHIKNDPSPEQAISLATDMMLETGYGIRELVDPIAEQLESEDPYVRETAVGCLLGRLRLTQYAEKGLQMTLKIGDQYSGGSGARSIALMGLGEVIDKIENKDLRKKTACMLLEVLYDEKDNISQRSAAHHSILRSLDTPYEKIPNVLKDVIKDYPIDEEKVKEFKKRYLPEA